MGTNSKYDNKYYYTNAESSPLGEYGGLTHCNCTTYEATVHGQKVLVKKYDYVPPKLGKRPTVGYSSSQEGNTSLSNYFYSSGGITND